MNANFLAFDLGAESGRAILGHLRQGVVEVREIRRFPNQPVRMAGSLHWDVPRLWMEMQQGIEESLPKLDSIGVDAWGVDYALIGENGAMIGNPFHYRDGWTDRVMNAVFEKVSPERIYSATGIQFLPFNTLYQFYAACRSTPKLIDAAEALVTIPDLMNYWLTGNLYSEYTIATTTQFVDPRTRAWATGLMMELALPVRLLRPLVEPGTEVGRLLRSVSGAFSGTPVIAPACHDTGSAIASISMSPDSAFLSSGTWSLLGAELARSGDHGESP